MFIKWALTIQIRPLVSTPAASTILLHGESLNSEPKLTLKELVDYGLERLTGSQPLMILWNNKKNIPLAMNRGQSHQSQTASSILISSSWVSEYTSAPTYGASVLLHQIRQLYDVEKVTPYGGEWNGLSATQIRGAEAMAAYLRLVTSSKKESDPRVNIGALLYKMPWNSEEWMKLANILNGRDHAFLGELDQVWSSSLENATTLETFAAGIDQITNMGLQILDKDYQRFRSAVMDGSIEWETGYFSPDSMFAKLLNKVYAFQIGSFYYVQHAVVRADAANIDSQLLHSNLKAFVSTYDSLTQLKEYLENKELFEAFGYVHQSFVSSPPLQFRSWLQRSQHMNTQAVDRVVSLIWQQFGVFEEFVPKIEAKAPWLPSEAGSTDGC